MGFLKKLFGTRRPPHPKSPPPFLASPQESIDAMAEALRRIQQEGGRGNFCVFVADEARNRFIQFAGQAGDAGMHAETCGSKVLRISLVRIACEHVE